MHEFHAKKRIFVILGAFDTLVKLETEIMNLEIRSTCEDTRCRRLLRNTEQDTRSLNLFGDFQMIGIIHDISHRHQAKTSLTASLPGSVSGTGREPIWYSFW